MGERNPLVKYLIPVDEIHGNILRFRAWNCRSSWCSWTRFLSFFSSLAFNFLSFDLMILTYVSLNYVSRLNLIKIWWFRVKRCKLGFKWSGKWPKDPWKSYCRNKRRPGLRICRLTDALFLGPLTWPNR